MSRDVVEAAIRIPLERRDKLNSQIDRRVTAVFFLIVKIGFANSDNCVGLQIERDARANGCRIGVEAPLPKGVAMMTTRAAEAEKSLTAMSLPAITRPPNKVKKE